MEKNELKERIQGNIDQLDTIMTDLHNIIVELKEGE